MGIRAADGAGAEDMLVSTNGDRLSTVHSAPVVDTGADEVHARRMALGEVHMWKLFEEALVEKQLTITSKLDHAEVKRLIGQWADDRTAWSHANHLLWHLSG